MLSMSLSPCCRFHPAEVNSRIGQFSAGHSAFALRLQARPSGILTFEATTRSLLGLPQKWGLGGNRRLRMWVVGGLESLSEAGTERAIVDGAANLEQKIGPSS